MRSLTNQTAFWMILFVAYATTAALIRITHIETLIGDDAESFLWSRTLDWGYGVQPPLYAWIHWGANRIFGETLASSVAVRAISHLGIFVGTFALARWFAPVRIAGLAALGVFMVPEIAQTFLRTRTHNILATGLAPLMVLTFLMLVERRRTLDYALFGVAAAFAILAKATVAILAAGLILAALTDRAGRQALWSRKVLLTVAILVALMAGPALWLATNFQLGTASLQKFQPTGERAEGIARFIRSMFDSWGAVAIFGALAYVLTRRGERSLQPGASLVWRAGAFAVVLLVAGLLLAGASEVKERWLVPILVPVIPILLVQLMQRKGLARFLPPALAGAYGIAMLLALPAYHRERPLPPIAPYAALADALQAIPADLILATSDVAANMWATRPDRPMQQWVPSERLACEGTVMLLVSAPGPADTGILAAQTAPCTLTPVSAQDVGTTPDGPVFRAEVLRLTPPG
jgi:4-amino-4-deoxy-L-arabinose transferase-like glycosyltransferase